MHYEASGYAVMIRVWIVNRWTWTTWMRFDTYKEAATHAREGTKIVPFGSPEWIALRQSPPAPPVPAQLERQKNSEASPDLIDFVLDRLSKWEIRELERLYAEDVRTALKSKSRCY